MASARSAAAGPERLPSSGSYQKIQGGKECLLNFARQQNIGEGAQTRELRNVGSGPSSAADSEAGQVTSSLCN